MQTIGLLIETRGGQLKAANFGLIAAAKGDSINRFALVLDGKAADVKERLQAHGVNKIIEISTQHGPLPWHPEMWADAVTQAMIDFDIQILIGLTSAQGKELLPRIAASLGAPLVMDCLAVDLVEHTVTKPEYSGKITAQIKTHGTHHIFGVRPNAIEAAPTPCEAQCIPYRVHSGKTQLNIVDYISSPSKLTDLTEADIILSGGRGLENAENFGLLRECADLMGAAVGASRVPVDSGWVPHDMQVGQTGKTVSPKVYIACGISGSVQHYAGMKTAGLIIAVNTDPKAAIMEKCDYFAVINLFDLIPELTRKLEQE
jgi:electron transfer flavoprotein alpha subunit